MTYTSSYLKRQRAKWREDLKTAQGLRPIWGAVRVPVNQHIPDHAFIEADAYQSCNREALVLTQHSPHSNADPSIHALIHAVDIEANKNGNKKTKKTFKPDDRWLNQTVTPPPTPLSPQRYTRINWDNFEPSHILFMVICKKCGTHISTELLAERGARQHCPHKVWS